MITLLVLRPCVASITVSVSFAREINRFTGAESGVTIQRIESVLTRFPNPTFSNLLNVLNLLSDLLDDRFEIDARIRNRQIR